PMDRFQGIVIRTEGKTWTWRPTRAPKHRNSQLRQAQAGRGLSTNSGVARAHAIRPAFSRRLQLRVLRLVSTSSGSTMSGSFRLIAGDTSAPCWSDTGAEFRTVGITSTGNAP